MKNLFTDTYVKIEIDPHADNWHVTCISEIKGQMFRNSYVFLCPGPHQLRFAKEYGLEKEFKPGEEVLVIAEALRKFSEYVRGWGL